MEPDTSARDTSTPDISLIHQLYERHRQFVGRGEDGITRDIESLLAMFRDGQRLVYTANDGRYRQARIDQAARIYRRYPHLIRVSIGEFMGNIPVVPHHLRDYQRPDSLLVLVDPRLRIVDVANEARVLLDVNARSPFRHLENEPTEPYWTQFVMGTEASNIATASYTKLLPKPLRQARVLEGLFALLHYPEMFKMCPTFRMRLAGDRVGAQVPHMYVGVEVHMIGVSSGSAERTMGHATVQT